MELEDWIKEFEAKGHIPLKINGEVYAETSPDIGDDGTFYGYDNHPIVNCVKCDYSECWMCMESSEIEQCKGTW